MLSSLRAELVKMRHLKLGVLAAAVGAAFSAIVFLIVRGALIRLSHERFSEVPWQNAVIGDTTIFAVLAFPTLVILLTAMSFYPEHRNNMWKQLRVVPMPIQGVYAAKFIVVLALMAIAVITAGLAAMLGWTLIPQSVRSLLPVSNTGVAITLASLASKFFLCLIPVALIQFALSARFSNVLHSVAIGLGFTVTSLLLSGPTTSRWFPYAYPAAVVIAEFGPPPRPVLPDQRTDVEFKLPRRAFGSPAGEKKLILVDESHANRHALGSADNPGTLRWIVAPATDAGIEVKTNSSRITSEILRGTDLLLIAGVPADAPSGTLTTDETSSIVRWIRDGGSLLLLTDHAPYSEAVKGLASELGVQFTGEAVSDAAFADPREPESARLVFSKSNGLLQENDLTKRVSRVITYGGQALSRAGSGTIEILRIPATAMTESGQRLNTFGRGSIDQMIAFPYGTGRVVISGETAVLTAQKKSDGSSIGLGDPWTSNATLAIEVMTWLLRR
jgi:hypothetical protein